jgi:dienelactone hydrolase
MSETTKQAKHQSMSEPQENESPPAGTEEGQPRISRISRIKNSCFLLSEVLLCFPIRVIRVIRGKRCSPVCGFIPVLAILLFLGAMFWAREQDPFSRNWFTLKTPDGGSVKCVAVLPKPLRQRSVIIYAHGAGGTLMNDGKDVRQMAEMGVAVVSLEYTQTNPTTFGPQFEALLRYIGRQSWADTNAIALVGYSMGSIRMFDFALQHPKQQPRLLVLLGGAGLPEGQSNNIVPSLHCPVFLIHGEQDQTFPVADTKRLASILQTNGLPVDMKVIPGMSHGMEPDRGIVFREIGEYCLTHLADKDALQNYYSIAQWQAEAPPLWIFLLPAAAWCVGWCVWSSRRKPRPSEKVSLSRSEFVLRWLAVLLATWALAESALHLVPPHIAITDKTLSIARRYLVQAKQHNDFESLAAQPIWQGEKLKTLLEHVELAGYNRELINWQLDDKMYRDYVLFPVITAQSGEHLNWRRPLWEEFYPRIRHESSPEAAAAIAARHLRERVMIAPDYPKQQGVETMWHRQIVNPDDFEIIYTAALRSVGVPARLNAAKRAEFWDGKNWQTAPRPVLETWQDFEK